jgi:predicted HTH domain antitoxin
MTMYITLPNDLHLDETTVRQVLAVALYQRHMAALGQASRLAGLSEAGFQALLAVEETAGAYGVAAFEEDLATLAEQSAP